MILEREVQEKIDLLKALCHMIEEGIKRDKGSVERIIHYDLFDFITYISSSDGKYNQKEIDFLNKALSAEFEVTPDTFEQFIQELDIDLNEIPYKVPLGLRLFLMRENHEYVENIQRAQYCKLYIKAFQCIGEYLIGIDGYADEREINNLTNYINMMWKYVDENAELFIPHDETVVIPHETRKDTGRRLNIYFTEIGELEIVYNDDEAITYSKETAEYLSLWPMFEKLRDGIRDFASKKRRYYNPDNVLTSLKGTFYDSLVEYLDVEIKKICSVFSEKYKSSHFSTDFLHHLSFGTIGNGTFRVSETYSVLDDFLDFINSCGEKVSLAYRTQSDILRVSYERKAMALNAIDRSHAGEGFFSSDPTAVLLWSSLTNANIESEKRKALKRIDKEINTMIGTSAETVEAELAGKVAEALEEISDFIAAAALSDMLEQLSQEEDALSINSFDEMIIGEPFGVTKSSRQVEELSKTTDTDASELLYLCPYSVISYMKLVDEGIYLNECAIVADFFNKSDYVRTLLENKYKENYSNPDMQDRCIEAVALLEKKDPDYLKESIRKAYQKYVDEKTELNEQLSIKKDELANANLLAVTQKARIKKEIVETEYKINSFPEFDPF